MLSEAEARRKGRRDGDVATPRETASEHPGAKHRSRPDLHTALDLDAEPQLPVELAGLRHLLTPDVLRHAQMRARTMGVGGDQVLLHAGLISPEALAAAQAAHLGIDLWDGEPVLLLPAEDVPGALRAGLALAGTRQAPVLVAGVRGRALRRLAEELAAAPAEATRVRLTSPETLRAALARHGAGGLAQAAADGLRQRHPHLSAADAPQGRRLAWPFLMVAAGLLLLAFFAPAALQMAVLGAVSTVFLCALGLRLASCLMPEPAPALPRLEDRHLPVYSILVPLYREAAMVPRLASALAALDYPPEKLDIKLILEPDDAQTRAAILAAHLPPRFEIITAAPIGPRTKPKALNAALPFARGTFVAVFDAEDVPDPGQLRAALACFQRGGPQRACVQARLVVENARERLITRHFAVEYCAHFDVLVPALAAMGMPILLGGTSNHFRRAALESAGGWDAYNVTEDADLGLRLSRLGWTIGAIASDTLEEAPVTLHAWLRQRTRWMKGWAQTLLVHVRSPGALLADLGLPRLLVALLLTAGPFVAMAVHPFSLAAVGHHLWTTAFAGHERTWGEVATLALCYVNLGLGYGVTAIISLLGLARRRRLAEAWILIGLPVYWLLQSLAVWRALADLATDPHRWDKTEHGTSRALRGTTPSSQAPAHITQDHITRRRSAAASAAGRLALNGARNVPDLSIR